MPKAEKTNTKTTLIKKVPPSASSAKMTRSIQSHGVRKSSATCDGRLRRLLSAARHLAES